MDGNSNRPRINVSKSIALSLFFSALIFIATRRSSGGTTGESDDKTVSYDALPQASISYDYEVHDINPVFSDVTNYIHIVNDEDELLSLSYVYRHFTAEQKALYGELCKAFRSHADRYDFSGKYSVDEVSFVISAMQYLDEYIMITGLPDISKWSKDGITYYLTMEYEYSKEVLDDLYTSSMGKVADILRNVQGMTAYEAEKFFHDKIDEMTFYDGSTDFSHLASGMFMNNIAVCDGYSKAFKILCNRAGIICDIVIGEGLDYDEYDVLIGSGPHAWNVVGMNGNVYYVDVTYDDMKDVDSWDYAYFNITYDEMIINHVLDDSFYYLPKSDSREYSYYTMMGYVAETEDDIFSVFAAQIDDYIDHKIDFIRIKILDDELFYKFVNRMGEGQLVSDNLQLMATCKNVEYNYMMMYHSQNNTVMLCFE